MILTFESDLDSVKMNQQTKYLSQRSSSYKVIVCTHRHRHTRPTAPPGPLKQSVN